MDALEGTPGNMDALKGTVGAVARDRAGHFAAATSTGGIVGKRSGRVGDSPIPGAGTWADGACALSATGDGEAILRVALSRSIAARIAAGTPLDTAVREGLRELARITGGSAGVIGVDATGVIGVQLSPTMPIAAIAQGVRSDGLGTQI
jgi:beta-aspartyl-peptidase (threonine type)